MRPDWENCNRERRGGPGGITLGARLQGEERWPWDHTESTVTGEER